MYDYHSRLHNGNSYTRALAGKFSGLDRDELLVCRNTVLELYIVNSTGNFERICCADLFSRILSMAVMHFTNKDYVAIGSDSGHALVLCYEAEMNEFRTLMKKYYSMPVCLPEYPGHFIATSHLGIGIGSLVENHLFFSFYKREPEDIKKLEPLVAHEPKYIIYDFVGIDGPNCLVPMFASLEVLCEQQKPVRTNLEISNLPANITEMELTETLKPYGTVISTRVMKIVLDLDMKSMAIGFVRMATQDMCENIISHLNGKLLPGSEKTLVVKFADDKTKQIIPFEPSEQRLPCERPEEEAQSTSDYKQYLKVYQVDFEENSVHLNEEELPEHGNMLISVPQGKEHPFGVIVCFPDKMTFKPFVPGFKAVTAPLPQRETDQYHTERGFLLTSSAVFEISEGKFVILAQTEQGDLFSIEIYQREEKLLSMRILYVDTIPVASSMCVISGRLFVAAEFGDNYLYDIKSFGNESEMTKVFDGSKLVVFEARKLENLSVVAKINSISPVMQAYVSDFACNGMKEFIFTCGKTPSSTLRFQRYGVKVSEVFEAVLPKLSNAVWSVNQEVSPGQTVTYILVSLMNRTMVASIDNKAIKVDYHTGFCSKVPTLGCAKCSEDSIIQVIPNGFRHIRSDHKYTEKIISEKYSEKSILHCALHYKQIAIALDNKDGLYFEVQEKNGKIKFEQVTEKIEFKSTVMCMSFIPKVVQAQHLVVCLKDTLEIYSVSLLKMDCVTTYKLGRIPESLGVVACLTNRDDFNSIIHIGYDDGYLQRISANEEKIVCEHMIKLGNKAVKLYTGWIKDKNAVLVLTNKVWISFYPCSQVFNLAPMDIDQKSDFAFLSASSCSTVNLVAVSREKNGQWEKKLHFLCVSNSVSMIEDHSVRLKYTPKQFVVNPRNSLLIIAETDIRHTNRKLFKIPGYEEMNPQRAMDLATSGILDSSENGSKVILDLEISELQNLTPQEDVNKRPGIQSLNISGAQNLEILKTYFRFSKDARKKTRSHSPKTSDTETSSSDEDMSKSPSFQMSGTSDAQNFPPEEEMEVSVELAETSVVQSLPPNLKRRRRNAYPNTDLTRKVPPNKGGREEPKSQISETSDAEKLPSEEDLNEKPSSCAVDSRLQIFDPIDMKTVFSEELPLHIAAVCMSFLQLEGRPLLLLVGTERVPQLEMPEEIDSHDIYIYKVTDDGKSFSLANKQRTKHVVSAICQIGNRVLIGLCKELCLYSFHWSTKTLKLCDHQRAKHPIVNIWCSKYVFIVETSDEVLTYGYLDSSIDCLYMFHQDRFMKGVSCLCFWDDNIIFVGDRKEIHAVLLPQWNDYKEPMSKSNKNEIMEMEKRLEEHSTHLSVTQIDEIVENIKDFDLSKEDPPPSETDLPSPTSPIPSSENQETETTFEIKSRPELAASRTEPLLQDPQSPTRDDEHFSHTVSSPSEAEPVTEVRTEESVQTESQPSISSDPPSNSYLLPLKYPHSVLKISDRSQLLTTHKIGEYVRSIQKTSLIREGRELIVYTTLSGAVGVIVPFLTEKHNKFFGPLEYLTFKLNPLLTTELMAPLNPNADLGDIFALCCDADQVTVDGNACEEFCKLPKMLQHHIALKLNTTYLELLQEIEKMKTSIFV